MKLTLMRECYCESRSLIDEINGSVGRSWIFSTTELRQKVLLQQWCSGGGTRRNAVPPLFSEGERDPSLFCSISGIFSAEINEQRRLQDSQFLQMLTY